MSTGADHAARANTPQESPDCPLKLNGEGYRIKRLCLSMTFMKCVLVFFWVSNVYLLKYCLFKSLNYLSSICFKKYNNLFTFIFTLFIDTILNSILNTFYSLYKLNA